MVYMKDGKVTEGGKKFAGAVVEVLELECVKYMFGHPGEQILPFYEALRRSNIKHILMRHEQGAAHAADAYARISGKFGVCIASAGPGALNLTMGVATAYKDSVPLLVITGDVPSAMKGCDAFQEVDTSTVFEPITIRSSNIKNPEEGILKLKEAIELIRQNKTGPVHLSIPRDVWDEEIDYSKVKEVILPDQMDAEELNENIGPAIKLLEKAQRPLIIAGAGIFWSKSAEKLSNFVDKNKIPV